MNRAEFTKFRDEHYRLIADINDKKGHDYAGDEDALANFKEMAATLNLSPEQIWGVYASKHWSAIMTFVREGDVQSEPIEGRIHDVILYCFLLLGLIEDGKPNPVESITWVCTGPAFSDHGPWVVPVGERCGHCGAER